MSSGVLSTTDDEGNIGIKQSKILFSDYKINWTKVPKHIMNLFEKQMPLDHYLNDFVHFIIDEMRPTSFYIPVPVMRKVAQEALSKYPKTLGIINGEGEINIEPTSLTAKLVYHNNYLNSKGPKRSLDAELKPQLIKKVKSLKESCPNWVTESDEEEDTLEQKRIYLKENFNISNLKQHEIEKINIYFEQTYTLQRKLLSNIETPPTLSVINQLWPHLLVPKYAKIHFQKLVDKSSIDMTTNAMKYFNGILKFSRTVKRTELKNLIESDSNQNYAALLFVTKYFKENVEYFIKKFPMGTSLHDVEPVSYAPWVAMIEVDPCVTTYYIFVEKIKCCSTTNFFEALETAFIFFFNFNMMYQKEMSLTMQFLQNIMGISRSFG